MNRLLARVLTVSIVLGALIAACTPASAKGFMYAGKRKKINCAVLLVNKVGGGNNEAQINEVGNLFFWLDRHPLKPSGWTFDNPFSPASPSTGLGKDNPAYWTIQLAASSSLSRFNVLYFPASGEFELSDQDREKLRRYVDNGGVLWIDNANPTTSPLDFNDTFFIRNFKFQSQTGNEVPANRHHPLISMPYWLTEMEVASLGVAPGKCVCYAGYDPLKNWGSYSNPPTDFEVLFPVVENTMGLSNNRRLASVAANAYGSGFIVATANYVGRGCNALSPEYAVPNYKFAYNVVSWASSFMTLRKDPRHTGASIDAIGGTKLVEHWSLTPAEPPIGGSGEGMNSSPVIYKNVAFYTSGGSVFAVDVFPSEDLDQDGNPDDGLQLSAHPAGLDFKGQDVVWMWSLTGGTGGVLSSPTVASIMNPEDPGMAIDVVLVMSSSGDVFMLTAFPSNPEGRLLDSTSVLAGPLPTAPTTNPTPPIYVNGWIYAVGGDGRLYAHNPAVTAWNSAGSGRSAADHWAVPTQFGDPRATSTPRSGPSFGFVKNDSSGAVVGMVYWFVSAVTGEGVTSASNNDFVYGIPVYVAHDRLKPKQMDQAGLVYQCRITYKDANISATPAPKVWIRTATSNTRLPDSEIEYDPSLPGVLTLRPSNPIPPDALVYAEYALDYTNTGVQQLILPRIRAQLEPRSSTASGVPETIIVGTPAMGVDGMLFLNAKRNATSGGNSGGSIYGLFNDGSTQVTRWSYLLHSGCDIPGAPGIDATRVPGVVVDKITGEPMRDPQPVGSPAVSGDKVFALVRGAGGSGPAAALLCFKASPSFVIQIMENAGYDANGQPIKRPKSLVNRANGRNMAVKVWQPNMFGALDPAGLQPLLSAQPVPPHMVDYDRGTIVFNNFDALKLRGVGLDVDVALTNIFSPSLPVWVYLDNVEVPIDYNTWGPAKALGLVGAPATSDSVDLSQWNNLLWYYIIPEYNGAQPTDVCSSPVVIGNTVYFSASYGSNEILFALNADTGENSGGPTSQKPIWQQLIPGGRLEGGSNVSVAASNGILLVSAGDGLHAFNNATTLVADSNRLVELDGAGEIAWSVDSISWPAAVPSSSSSVVARRSGAVNKPTRAKYINNGDIVLVNTGANQVCRIDKNGWVNFSAFGSSTGSMWFVRWMYDKFCDPANLLRPGQPQQLRSPTDAVFWQELEYVPGATSSDKDPYMLVVHCLVADSGNHRIIDLVYRIRGNNIVDRFGAPIDPMHIAPERYDQASGFLLPELNWVTKTDSMNERYSYDCIQIVGGDTIWAAISNYRTGTNLEPPSGVETGQGLGGAIVAIGYRTRTGFDSPWNYASDGSGEIIARCDRVNWGSMMAVSNPRYFQVIESGGNRSLLICDNNGVYMADIPAGGGVPVVSRGLRDADYRRMARQLVQSDGLQIPSPGNGLGAPLYATCVQELPNGNWLITNGYSGTDKMPIGGTSYSGPANQFKGEIFEFNPYADAGTSPIGWYSPKLVVPETAPGSGVFDPEYRKQTLDNSYILQQPRSALRMF